MKKVAINPTTILHPHPVLLVGTFGPDGKPNLMNAAWGGICCSDPPCVAVSLREATLTYHNILHAKAFTVGIPHANTSRSPTTSASSLAAIMTSSGRLASRHSGARR
jgi:flavin reductase (DIM6/NTAB) family NADH-FMN oxidoreductase RutF